MMILSCHPNLNMPVRRKSCCMPCKRAVVMPLRWQRIVRFESDLNNHARKTYVDIVQDVNGEHNG
jgi:hypothetical protein